eukprot:1821461-Alexandrium_andersonii.AAC.1
MDCEPPGRIEVADPAMSTTAGCGRPRGAELPTTACSTLAPPGSTTPAPPRTPYAARRASGPPSRCSSSPALRA